MPLARSATAWTRERVETRLIAAFRVMPGCPVYGAGRRYQAATAGRTALTEVLDWAALLERDAEARKYLWAWARCRATGSSYGELCRDMGWPRATAEAGRRRGALAIAAQLARREPAEADLTMGKPAAERPSSSRPRPVGARGEP